VIGPDEYDHEDSVVVINWVYDATDDETPLHTARIIGTTVVAWDEESPNFVPFPDLTTSIVDSWVEDKLGEEQIVMMKSGLDRNIAQQITPLYKTFDEMPWDNGS
jgi:hypothetical protein